MSKFPKALVATALVVGMALGSVLTLALNPLGAASALVGASSPAKGSHQGVLQQALDTLVGNGTITKSQADAVSNQVHENRAQRLAKRPVLRRGVLNEIAAKFNMSPKDLLTELRTRQVAGRHRDVEGHQPGCPGQPDRRWPRCQDRRPGEQAPPHGRRRQHHEAGAARSGERLPQPHLAEGDQAPQQVDGHPGATPAPAAPSTPSAPSTTRAGDHRAAHDGADDEQRVHHDHPRLSRTAGPGDEPPGRLRHPGTTSRAAPPRNAHPAMSSPARRRGARRPGGRGG